MPLAPCDFGDPMPEMRRDGVIGKESRRSDEKALPLEAAREVLLRQRWSLIGRPWLIADERELSGEAATTQGVDSLHGSLPAPRNHDPLVHPSEE